MGANGAKYIVLMNCGAAEAAWVTNADNHLRNASWGPQGLLAVDSPIGNKDLLFTTGWLGAGTPTWEQWSGYVVCSSC
jgi:hypothetical protein